MQFLQTSAQPPSSNNLIEEIDSKCGGYKLSIQFAMTCDAIAILHRVTNSPAAQFRLEHSRWCQLSRPHPANQRRVHGGCLSLPSSSWIIQIVQTPSVFFSSPLFCLQPRVCVCLRCHSGRTHRSICWGTQTNPTGQKRSWKRSNMYFLPIYPPPLSFPCLSSRMRRNERYSPVNGLFFCLKFTVARRMSDRKPEPWLLVIWLFNNYRQPGDSVCVCVCLLVRRRALQDRLWNDNIDGGNTSHRMARNHMKPRW